MLWCTNVNSEENGKRTQKYRRSIVHLPAELVESSINIWQLAFYLNVIHSEKMNNELMPVNWRNLFKGAVFISLVSGACWKVGRLYIQ